MSGGAAPRRAGPVDPGLQPERTRLAWSRTSLAFLANGGLMLHAGHKLDHWGWMVPGAVIIAASVLVYGMGVLRYRQVGAAIRAGRTVAGPAPVAVTAGVAAFVALTAVVVLASGHH
jgi:uncharacterized membrane protein YidH (DUF202 family)